MKHLTTLINFIVLLTLIPAKDTRRDEAEWLAANLGMPLIAPDVGSLTTFDRNHLDAPSAERWAQAFFAEAGGRLEACLGDTQG